MPRSNDPIPPRIAGTCDEPTCCGSIPESRRSKRREGGIARFCSEECYRKHHKRKVVRGARIYETALAWRTYPRSHLKGAKNPPNPYFAEMTGLLDRFAREDREMRAAARKLRFHADRAVAVYQRAASVNP